MATAKLVDIRTTRLSNLSQGEHSKIRVKELQKSPITINQVKYSKINVKELQKSPTTIKEVLPFRVRFTNIGIRDDYGPLNPAPIGIAIIGLNNYIL